mmetsp:Transcript_41710/g.97654  ORF Transcript_41710/g.97654 Transcript_41710/m.97654 type:complete len:210 (+) Transcript_41710:3029-3658(+)
MDRDLHPTVDARPLEIFHAEAMVGASAYDGGGTAGPQTVPHRIGGRDGVASGTDNIGSDDEVDLRTTRSVAVAGNVLALVRRRKFGRRRLPLRLPFAPLQDRRTIASSPAFPSDPSAGRSSALVIKVQAYGRRDIFDGVQLDVVFQIFHHGPIKIGEYYRFGISNPGMRGRDSTQPASSSELKNVLVSHARICIDGDPPREGDGRGPHD